MPTPAPITAAQLGIRRNRVSHIARELGFVGRTEYRHAFSQSGGAQYSQANMIDEDLLIVYAEAFERDEDPDEFSLEAIIAHARGHQILAHHWRISKLVSGRISLASEEVLASLLGSMICSNERDRDTLVGKATVELLVRGESVEQATERLGQLWNILEPLL